MINNLNLKEKIFKHWMVIVLGIALFISLMKNIELKNELSRLLLHQKHQGEQIENLEDEKNDLENEKNDLENEKEDLENKVNIIED